MFLIIKWVIQIIFFFLHFQVPSSDRSWCLLWWAWGRFSLGSTSSTSFSSSSWWKEIAQSIHTLQHQSSPPTGSTIFRPWFHFSIAFDNKKCIIRTICSVLGKSHLGAGHHFWVKTRFGILVESSFIWANQVWPRAILAPKNDKNNKNCSD